MVSRVVLEVRGEHEGTVEVGATCWIIGVTFRGVDESHVVIEGTPGGTPIAPLDDRRLRYAPQTPQHLEQLGECVALVGGADLHSLYRVGCSAYVVLVLSHPTGKPGREREGVLCRRCGGVLNTVEQRLSLSYMLYRIVLFPLDKEREIPRNFIWTDSI